MGVSERRLGVQAGQSALLNPLQNRTWRSGHSKYVGSDQPLDSELWERVAAHDGQAFGRLFDRHARRIYNHCFWRTADWSLAEDLTSIVFLEAWRRRRDVDLSGDSLLPWLLGVANNAIRNAERSRRRYRRLLNKLPKVIDSPAGDAEIASRLDDVEAMKAILGQLKDLRQEEQDVLALCDWSGVSVAEAATALGLPIGTVKSRLNRARDQLRGPFAAQAPHVNSDLAEEVRPE